MTTTAEMKSRAHPHPEHRSNPSEEGAAPTPHVEGVTPAATATTGLSPITTNFSVAPGPIWLQFTNDSAISVLLGSLTTVTAKLPLQGAAGTFLDQFVSDPARPDQTAGIVLGALVFAPPSPEVPIFSLPVPQFRSPLANSTPGLPITVGINRITVEPNITPDTATTPGSAGTISIHLVADTVSTIPAGRRWLIFSMTGV